MICSVFILFVFSEGELPELIDVIIQEKASLFVSAVGVPPAWAVDKLHAAGILSVYFIYLIVFHFCKFQNFFQFYLNIWVGYFKLYLIMNCISIFFKFAA